MPRFSIDSIPAPVEWSGGRTAKLELVRQVLSFGAVGVCATVCHASVAWMLITAGGVDPYLANFLGVAIAFWISFLGNAFLTFKVKERLVRSGWRTLVLALVSFIVSTIVLAIVKGLGLPNFVYIVVMLFTVPPASFLLAKLWAFYPQTQGR